jgi:peptidyl-prolyl cis-trans isomerase C
MTGSTSTEHSAADQTSQQKAGQTEVETELMTTQPAEAQPETEMMAEQPAETEAEMMTEQPVEPETEVTAEQPAETQPVTGESEPKTTEQTPQPSPDDIVVTVNGTEVKRERLDKYLEPQLERMSASGRVPDDRLAEMKNRLTRRFTDVLVIETLIDQQMKKNNIVVTEQQIEDRIAEMAARENLTVDDLKAIVTRNGGTFEQWKERMQFDKIVGVLKLAELEGLGTADVNEADALAYYQQNQDSYKIPEQVRASHILITPEKGPDVDPEAADAAAREKAEQLLEQVKAGADFAQLAKENSDCPSASKGGDLGFGRRQTWVAPFSDAAFALQPGQISDVVKTRFGYHIIKVTDRKEPTEIPFDNVKENIIQTLRTKKESELTNKCIDLLKSKADIVYAEGYEPEQTDYTVP